MHSDVVKLEQRAEEIRRNHDNQSKEKEGNNGNQGNKTQIRFNPDLPQSKPEGTGRTGSGKKKKGGSHMKRFSFVVNTQVS